MVERIVEKEQLVERARTFHPVQARVTEVIEGGRMTRTYEFGGRLSPAACAELLRTIEGLADHPHQVSGHVEARPDGAHWHAGGREIELTVGDRSTRLVATDTSTAGGVVVFVALATTCVILAILIRPAILWFIVAIAFVMGFQVGVERPRQFERSRQLFESVAKLVGGALR